ncbi:unnamed protein product [Enterobius vermicularis]|uniref:Uncharacterized protein n=1 Tax=Enterobius vermicularis TaxID=51028 RepID=A0A0N4VGL2_ENTVE|nr:unnamed protein product [Enterobius vermicularis]
MKHQTTIAYGTMSISVCPCTAARRNREKTRTTSRRKRKENREIEKITMMTAMTSDAQRQAMIVTGSSDCVGSADAGDGDYG